MSGLAYYEHKFLVPDGLLPHVQNVLDSLFGGTDPYPCGQVDSLYFDTLERRAFRECFNGEPHKRKFRVRGYGDGIYSQFHIKQKQLAGVEKVKLFMEPMTIDILNDADPLAHIRPRPGQETPFAICKAMSSQDLLFPCVRVQYTRHRFRVGDDRVTLDTNIEASPLGAVFRFSRDFVRLRWNVVEVKTTRPTPSLPILGLASLPAVSFSKFFLGQQLLAGEDIWFF